MLQLYICVKLNHIKNMNKNTGAYKWYVLSIDKLRRIKGGTSDNNGNNIGNDNGNNVNSNSSSSSNENEDDRRRKKTLTS
jgi:hypothetical protein